MSIIKPWKRRWLGYRNAGGDLDRIRREPQVGEDLLDDFRFVNRSNDPYQGCSGIPLGKRFREGVVRKRRGRVLT